jgi:hypothetical protein
MSERVDAAVNRTEHPALDSSIDGASLDPQTEELPPRHHPVLAPSQLRNQSVRTLFHPRSVP